MNYDVVHKERDLSVHWCYKNGLIIQTTEAVPRLRVEMLIGDTIEDRIMGWNQVKTICAKRYTKFCDLQVPLKGFYKFTII